MNRVITKYSSTFKESKSDIVRKNRSTTHDQLKFCIAIAAGINLYSAEQFQVRSGIVKTVGELEEDGQIFRLPLPSKYLPTDQTVYCISPLQLLHYLDFGGHIFKDLGRRIRTKIPKEAPPHLKEEVRKRDGSSWWAVWREFRPEQFIVD